jgi:hypothetical protein
MYSDYWVLDDANGGTIADDGSAAGEYSGWMDNDNDPDARLIPPRLTCMRR